MGGLSPPVCRKAHHGERVQESLDPNGIRKFMNCWRYIFKIEWLNKKSDVLYEQTLV